MPSPQIIAETDTLLVIDKPAGLITHRDGRNEEPSVAEWLGEKFPEMRGAGEAWVSPQGERVEVNGLVHRLDRATSGVLLAAKTQEMFEYLKGEFKARRVEKTYRAIVYGTMEGEGTIVAEIMRSNVPPKRWYARPTTADDKRAAITEWKVLKHIDETATLLELHPKTGRTHQLRVHLASIGHPIVGDHLYGAGMPHILGIDRLALHAYQISLDIESKRETFAVPMPDDLAKAASC